MALLLWRQSEIINSTVITTIISFPRNDTQKRCDVGATEKEAHFTELANEISKDLKSIPNRPSYCKQVLHLSGGQKKNAD